MVNSASINDKMIKYVTRCLIVLFTLLEVFVRTQISVRETNHGFLHDNEVRYLVDDISTIHKEFSPGTRNPKFHDASLNSFLKFEPEFLDFKERPLGIPHLEKVTLFNVNNNESVDMTSISGNTQHFHSSFFEDKKIPPLGNTSFNIVFLGREEGHIESSLFIHTTEGSYRYHVKGASVASPYRLRPLVDIRLPPNSSFSPLIYMHNPHTHPIQIVEVYSSGGEFHLELPTGELEGPKDMWEIPPFQTKPIIRVKFNAKTENNYTAYVRIKMNNIKEVLIIPLEVEVSSQCGIHTPQGTVDFGVGGTLDKQKQLKLLVYNNFKKAVRIHSIAVSTKAIKVDFQPVKISPDLKEPTQIAMLTLDWKSLFDLKDFFGKITVRYKQGKSKVEIPYWVTIFEGGLSYNISVTNFLMDNNAAEHSPRNFTVTNQYEYPLAITNISIPVEVLSYFSIKEFKPVILKPKETVSLFLLNFKSTVSFDLKLKSYFTIQTNVSDVEIPLLSYNGKLTFIMPTMEKEENVLNLGVISTESTKEAHFILMNENPTDIKLLHFENKLQYGRVEFLGCSSGNIWEDLHLPPENMMKCLHLKPGEYGVFRVLVETPKLEGLVSDKIWIETQFEKRLVHVRFRVAQGNIEICPSQPVFDECFPGRICMHPLRIYSTFKDPIRVHSVSSIPFDERVSSVFKENVAPRSSELIGHLYLDPNVACGNNCYTGLPVDSLVGNDWLKSFSLPQSTYDLDLLLLNEYHARFLILTSNNKKWQNITMKLDTNLVKGHIFHSRVKMGWPKLVIGNVYFNKSVFNFPLTQIGNVSYRNISIRNPSNSILIIQLVMDWVYPQSKHLFKNLPNTFYVEQEVLLESQTFFFHEKHKYNQTKIREVFDIRAHPETVALTIPPQGTLNVTIGFRASVASLKSAYLYVRNNLTILEVLKLSGHGVHPGFKFGNRRPGSSSPLVFEFTEKQLKECEKEKYRKLGLPSFTERKIFYARNTGAVPITVSGFYINGYPCEGFGFKVVNCYQFDILPNSSKKVELAFTPDFTLSRVQRTLTILTSLNMPVNYTLVATLPTYFLAPCSSAMSRPGWEPLIYYASVSFMTFLLFTVISICFIESDRILTNTLLIKDVSTQPLDLRMIGAQTRNEIRSHKTENAETNTVTINSASNASTISNGTHKPVKETRSTCTNSAGKVGWSPDSKECHSNKHEDQKYVSVSPTLSTTKVKKKLAKKNSAENTSSDACFDSAQKKPWSTVFPKLPNNKSNSKQSVPAEPIEPKKSPPVANVNSKLDTKKIIPVQKEIRKQPVAATKSKSSEICSEEETSSTTTESSNNEEVEKLSEVHKKERVKKAVATKKNVNNKSPVISSCDFGDNYEGDEEDEVFEKESLVSTNNKCKPRIENKPSKDTHEVKSSSESPKPSVLEVVKTKSTNNKVVSRDRKERLPQKRRVLDRPVNKTVASSDANCFVSNVSVARVSPPVPPVGVWGENRATFSDVVSRSDASSLAVHTTQRATQTPSKPTLCVEPTQKQVEPKQSLADLGPIGWKKPDVWTDAQKATCAAQPVAKPAQISHSLFTEPVQGVAVGHQSSLFNGGKVSDIWASPDSTVDPVHSNADSGQQASTLDSFRESWSQSGFWEPLCTPVGENRPQQNSFLPGDYFWTMPTSSLWSLSPWSSSYAAPTETSQSNTPLRTPPGFSREDSENQMPRFDLFGSFGNIWTPQTPGSWNYSPRNNNQ